MVRNGNSINVDVTEDTIKKIRTTFVSALLRQIHDRSLSWLGTGTSVNVLDDNFLFPIYFDKPHSFFEYRYKCNY